MKSQVAGEEDVMSYRKRRNLGSLTERSQLHLRAAVCHSAASPADTETNCRGISAVLSWSCELAVLMVALTVARPCMVPGWMLVRMSVVPPVVMMLSEDTAPPMLATMAPPPPFLFWCVFMCLARWSLRMNRFEHSEHTNFFSPDNGQMRNDTEMRKRTEKLLQNPLHKDCSKSSIKDMHFLKKKHKVKCLLF